MNTLQELKAEFIRYEKGVAGPEHGRKMPDGTYQYGGFEIERYIPVESLEQAQGIQFLCPLCFAKNNGSIGTHSISISFANRGVTDEQGSRNKEGRPTRWEIIGGNGLGDLQLAPSILLESGCQWHGFIGNSGVPAGYAN